MSTIAACIDHVILLVPYSWLASPPPSLSQNFVITPGGRHADGKTENRLILFKDGSYLELIAFIDDKQELRKGHWWDKPYGVVDYCLTTTTAVQWDAVNAAIASRASNIRYAAPQAGGRTRPDGVKLEWLVTFPQGAERGLIPFWCHDITPRDRRVPITAENTLHPCGAVGVSKLSIIADETLAETARMVLSVITDSSTTKEPFTFARVMPITSVPLPAVAIDVDRGVAKLHLKLTLQLMAGSKLPGAICEVGGMVHLTLTLDKRPDITAKEGVVWRCLQTALIQENAV